MSSRGLSSSAPPMRVGIGTVVVAYLADAMSCGGRRLPGLLRADPSAPLDERYSVVDGRGRYPPYGTGPAPSQRPVQDSRGRPGIVGTIWQSLRREGTLPVTAPAVTPVPLQLVLGEDEL